MDITGTLAPRTALFVPAGRPRAIARAQVLDADLFILDLEDAVPEADKVAARAAIADAVAGFAGRTVAVRVNGADSAHFAGDLAAVRESDAACVVVPKVEHPDIVAAARSAANRPVLAMVETPSAILALREIAAAPGLIGLIAGTNDLAAALRLPPAADRSAMTLSLQAIVLAARAHGLWALDGVFNALTDIDGLSAQAAEGRAMGFDGKTLIHPDQIAPVAAAFAPTAEEVEEARALLSVAGLGAVRFRDRMVEDMHVAAARALLARADRAEAP